MLKITVQLNGYEVLARELAPGRYLVGSDPGCDLVLEHPQIQARHAWLIVEAAGLACQLAGQDQPAMPLAGDQPWSLGPFQLTCAPSQGGADPATRVVKPVESAASARLRIRGGEQDGTLFELPPGRHQAGRAPESALHLVHPSVSRQHAEFAVDADGVQVRDLGSAAGVLINGRRVSQARLQPGDSIRLGEVELVLAGEKPVRPDTAGVKIAAAPPPAPAKRRRLILYGCLAAAVLLLVLAVVFSSGKPERADRLDQAVREHQRSEEEQQRRRLIIINLAKARQALEAGAQAEALPFLRNILAADPGHAEARQLLDKTQAEMAQAQTREQEAQAQRSRRMAQRQSLLDGARAALAAAQFDRAQEAVAQALALDPNDAEARHLAFQAQAQAEERERRQRQEIETAQLRQAEAERLAQTGASALKAGRLADARRDLAAAQSLDPEDKLAVAGQVRELLAQVEQQAGKQADSLAAQGGQSLKKGDLVAAQNAFAKALAIKPGHQAAAQGLEKASAGLKRQAVKLVQEGDVLDGLGKRAAACAKWEQARKLLARDDPLRAEVIERLEICRR